MTGTWTPTLLRRLSPMELELLFGGLCATTLPSGTFAGRAWGYLPPPLWLFACWIWRGKVFTGDQVRNRILGREWIEGEVELVGRSVVIWYPQLRLTDTLRPVTPTLWLGRMRLVNAAIVHFTLEQEDRRR